MKRWLLGLVIIITLLIPLILTACAHPASPTAKDEDPVLTALLAEPEEWEKSITLKRVVAYYQGWMWEMRQAKREDLINALGQDIYNELDAAHQQGGVRGLMEKIPEIFTRNEDPYAVRYHSVYDVFRYRSGRCGEEAHLAFGILYLFGVPQLEIVHSTADHVWLMVGGNHYDPGLTISDGRYSKDAYRAWDAPFAFMLAIDINCNVRDVTAEYVNMTPEVIKRRASFKNK